MAYASAIEARLWSDYHALLQLESEVITWKALDCSADQPKPPLCYQIHYELRSIIDWESITPIYHTGFNVNVDLNPPYPTLKPKVWFVGHLPYHPSIHPDGRICYEDRLILGIGIRLDQICEIIGMMITFSFFPRRDHKPIRTSVLFWERFDAGKRLYPTDSRPILNLSEQDIRLQLL